MLASDMILSAESREALHDLIWSIPQNELLSYAATGAALMGGGFRKNNLAVVRARVMQVAEGKEQIDDNLRKLLVRHDHCASCLAVLSEATIKENLEDLAALFGAPRLALALQLDSRLAAKNTLCASARSASLREKTTPAASALREALAPLLSGLGANETEMSRAFESTTALKEARKEISNLKGAAERLEKEMAKREKAETDAKKWREKAETAERTIGPLRQRAEKAEADLARLTREAEAFVEAKLETHLAAEFAEWLGGRRAGMLREIWPANAGEVGPAGAGEVGPAGAGEVRSSKPQAARAASNLRRREPPATSGGTSRLQPQAAARGNSSAAGPRCCRHGQAGAGRPGRRYAQRA